MTKLIRTAFISVTLGFSFASVVAVEQAVAGRFEDGKSAYDRKDYATALKDFRIAAKAGDARAMNGLGVMYGSGGSGLPEDRVRGYMWLSLAVELGSSDDAAGNLAFVAKGMTPSQITQAKAMAAQCQSSRYTDCGE